MSNGKKHHGDGSEEHSKPNWASLKEGEGASSYHYRHLKFADYFESVFYDKPSKALQATYEALDTLSHQHKTRALEEALAAYRDMADAVADKMVVPRPSAPKIYLSKQGEEIRFQIFPPLLNYSGQAEVHPTLIGIMLEASREAGVREPDHVRSPSRIGGLAFHSVDDFIETIDRMGMARWKDDTRNWTAKAKAARDQTPER